MLNAFNGSNTVNTTATTDGKKRWWKYTNPSKPDYREMIEGTIVQLEVVASTKWSPQGRYIDRFIDGVPKKSIRFTVLDAVDNQDTLFELPCGKNGALAAIMQQCFPGQPGDVEQLAGKYVRIVSPQGHYGMGNPRPFNLTILGENPHLYRGTIDWNDSKDWERNGQGQGVPAQQFVPPVQQAPVQATPVVSQPYQQQPQAMPQQQPAPQQMGYVQQPQAGGQQPIQQYQQPQQQPAMGATGTAPQQYAPVSGGGQATATTGQTTDVYNDGIPF